ncbi:hypothetical protein D0A37_02385 [Microcoleus vaginatus HSN003]|nr:hypothetical protein D0A37_02385 [Microcoleus vaginatus HSN003]
MARYRFLAGGRKNCLNCLKYWAGRTLNNYLGIFVNIPGKVRQTKKTVSVVSSIGADTPDIISNNYLNT